MKKLTVMTKANALKLVKKLVNYELENMIDENDIMFPEDWHINTPDDWLYMMSEQGIIDDKDLKVDPSDCIIIYKSDFMYIGEQATKLFEKKRQSYIDALETAKENLLTD